MSRLALLLACATLVLSGGCARGRALEAPGHSSGPYHAPGDDAADTEAIAEPERARLPRDVVERAAAPWHAVEVKTGAELDPERFFDRLGGASAVCVGERHPTPSDHYAQLAVLRGLAERSRISGRELALGLEMVSRPYQRALDAWLRGASDEEELLEVLDWDARWGFDFSLYRPLLELAQRERLGLVALNAPRELTRKVAREGVEALPPEVRRLLPELDLDDPRHRAAFDQALHGAPHHGDREKLYQAQVLWDETMADAAASFLAARKPARQLVIAAGRAHCQVTAIPARLARRGAFQVVSVLPGVGPDDAKAEGYDFQLVLEAAAASGDTDH